MVTPFVLDVVGHSAFTFTQIRNNRIAAGIDTETDYAVGHTDPMYRGTRQQRALIEFGTPQLATLLNASYANCGIRGNSSVITAGAISTYFKQKTTTGTTARATANHRRLTINAWHMHWSKITLPHRGMAEATVTINAVYDGINAPIVYTNGVALPGNLTALEQFGCGPVSINGSSISSLVENIEIDSGVRVMQLSGQDDVWDVYCATEVTDPVVTIKCTEEINWAALGLAGIELNGSTGLEFYARRKGSNGPLANGTASHIYFKGVSGRCIPVDNSGQGSSVITDTLRVELNALNDTTLPLGGTVGSVIT